MQDQDAHKDQDRTPAAFYRLFDHTADIGMEIFGADAPELFSNAGRALFENLVSAPPHDRACSRRTIRVEGADWADLMVNWLRELLYLWNGEQKVLQDVRIDALSQNELSASVTLFDFNSERDRPAEEIKAVTYHQIAAGPFGKGWRARVIFDV